MIKVAKISFEINLTNHSGRNVGIYKSEFEDFSSFLEGFLEVIPEVKEDFSVIQDEVINVTIRKIERSVQNES